MGRLVYDIEANSVDPYKVSTIHCICARDYDTGEEFTFVHPINKEEVRKVFNKYETFICHNQVGYDRIVLIRLCDISLPINVLEDTLVLSRLANQQRPGGHSLENWGTILHSPKTGLGITDWSILTPEMLARCQQDVRLNAKVYSYVTQELKDFSRRSQRLEHSIAYLLEECTRVGFKFDVKASDKLFMELTARVNERRKNISDSFYRIPKSGGTVTPRFTKDGKLYKGYTTDAPYSKVEWQEFNPGSTDHVIKVLEGHWEPTEMTPGGQPKVNENNLATILDSAPPAAKLIKDYKILASRLSTLEGWMKCVEPDGRVHGSILHIGTPHHRCSHIKPNMGNVPGVEDKFGRKNPYGKEFRDLWTCEYNRVLVNPDATGIQNRILAHLRQNSEFTKVAVSGDIHQYHADLTGYTRAQMKRFFYAWMRGCGKAMAGRIVLGGPKEGEELIEAFLNKNPDMKELIERAKGWVKQGFYQASDGRRVAVDSLHLALDRALVAEEACIMKLTMVLADKEYKQHQYDTFLVNFVHDEDLYDTTDDGKTPILVGDKWVNSLKKAGEILGIKCQLDGKYGIGKTWAVH